MQITDKTVKNVAKVARIDLSEDEIKMFTPQFKEILEWFETLNEADTDKAEPSFLPIAIPNDMREDTPEDPLSQEEALKNTKHVKDGFFKGPKAV